MLEDGSVIEAWHKGGVRHVKDPADGHKPGTVVDVYSIKAEFDEYVAELFLTEQIGKKYDFRSVARFVSRRKAIVNGKWFCSELAEAALIMGGLALLRGDPENHSPRDTAMSPYLKLTDQITLGKI